MTTNGFRSLFSILKPSANKPIIFQDANVNLTQAELTEAERECTLLLLTTWPLRVTRLTRQQHPRSWILDLGALLWATKEARKAFTVDTAEENSQLKPRSSVTAIKNESWEKCQRMCSAVYNTRGNTCAVNWMAGVCTVGIRKQIRITTHRSTNSKVSVHTHRQSRAQQTFPLLSPHFVAVRSGLRLWNEKQYHTWTHTLN